MYYIDAEAQTYDRTAGSFIDHPKKLFLKDQIHLTEDARRMWAKKWIIPMMEKLNI